MCQCTSQVKEIPKRSTGRNFQLISRSNCDRQIFRKLSAKYQNGIPTRTKKTTVVQEQTDYIEVSMQLCHDTRQSADI